MSSANIMAWIQAQQAQMEADRQTRIQQQKERDKKHNAIAADRKKKNDAKALASSNLRLDSVQQGMLNQARADLQRQGYSGPALEQIMTDLTQRFTTTRAGISGPVTNANDIFNLNDLPTIIGDVNSQYQKGLKGELDQIFTKGFETGLIPESADDAWIADIIGKQSASAKERLEAQLKRGTINQSGFDAGMADLLAQEKAGTAKAQGVGSAALTTQRGLLTGTADKWFNDILDETTARTSPFDTGAAKTELDTQFADINKNLEGTILNALGGEQYFDIDNIIASAGLRSGSLNNVSAAANTASAIPGANGVTAPLENRSIDESEQSRLRREGIF